MSDQFGIYADILTRLPDLRRGKSGYTFRCPFGDKHKSGYDRNPSASVSIGRTGNLCVGCFGCHAGFQEFVEYTGVPAHQWFPDRGKWEGYSPERLNRTPKKVGSFDYEHADGRWAGTKSRWEPSRSNPGKPKSFDWVWADGVTEATCPLYKLPQLTRTDWAEPVFIAEGEGKVDRIMRYGFTATCAPHGSNQWLDAHTESLKGRWVVVLPDDDRPGKEFAEKVAVRAMESAEKVTLVRCGRDGFTPPPGGDVKDWLRETVDPRSALRVLAQNAPSFVRHRGGFFR